MFLYLMAVLKKCIPYLYHAFFDITRYMSSVLIYFFIVKLHFSFLYNDDWKLHFLQNITWIMNFKYSAISCLFFFFVFYYYILHAATSAALKTQKMSKTRGNYLCSVYRCRLDMFSNMHQAFYLLWTFIAIVFV